MDVLGLAVLVLKHVAEAAVEDARLALGQARGVLAGFEPAAAGLGADQLDLGVLDERIKHARRVRAAAHAGDHGVGQAVQPLQALLPRFAADHRLEVADDHGKRVRTDHAADRVMRFLRRSHPVAHRLVGRVAQGLRSGCHRHDGRAQGPHVEDVQLLPADVFLAHVDRAFQAEEGTGRRRGDAVLAGPGLGDDPLLAHPRRQHHLADRVVDLVGAGVVQVFALEIDLGPARRTR